MNFSRHSCYMYVPVTDLYTVYVMLYTDTACTNQNGVCQYDNAGIECDGTYQSGICNGPSYRRCCLPYDDPLWRGRMVPAGQIPYMVIFRTIPSGAAGKCRKESNRRLFLNAKGRPSLSLSNGGAVNEYSVIHQRII